MYLNPSTLSNQSSFAPGLLLLTAKQESMYLQYNGFVKIISTDPVEIEPNIEAWEAWKKAESEKPLPESIPTPTQLDKIEAQATYTAMLTDTLLPEVTSNES